MLIITDVTDARDWAEALQAAERRWIAHQVFRREP